MGGHRVNGSRSHVDLTGTITDEEVASMTVTALTERVRATINVADLDASAGVTTEEVTKRLARDGPNALEQKKRTPAYIRFLKKLLDPILILLFLASGLSFVVAAVTPGDMIDLALGIFLLCIIL